MPDPSQCRFSDSHEWFYVEGDSVTIGISKFAADELTDITYVEMKKPGDTVKAGDSIGEIESVKTTADIYSAISGEIYEVNSALDDDPGKVNSDSYGDGWLVRIRTGDSTPLDQLMDWDTYQTRHPVS